MHHNIPFFYTSQNAPLTYLDLLLFPVNVGPPHVSSGKSYRKSPLPPGGNPVEMYWQFSTTHLPPDLSWTFPVRIYRKIDSRLKIDSYHHEITTTGYHYLLNVQPSSTAFRALILCTSPLRDIYKHILIQLWSQTDVAINSWTTFLV